MSNQFLFGLFSVLLLPASLFAAEISFDPKHLDLGAGISPGAIVAGDLNADGKEDLAVANNGNSGYSDVSILLGNGDGTFQPAVNYPAGKGARSLASSDLNFDGKPDLVVANYNSNNISILLGNGDGTFRSAPICTAGLGPNAVSIGDLDGDGKADLVVANYSGKNISILRGNGDGTFQSAVNYNVGSYTYTYPYAVAIGDLNADGKSDLAVAVYGTTTVALLRGNGDGTFQAAVNVTVGNGPRDVAIGDVTGDGTPDLVAANWVSNNVSLLRGRGDGTFLAAVNYNVGSSACSVAIDDLNADGKPDLVVGSQVVASEENINLSILRGNGDGAFQRVSASYVAGGSPTFVAIRDFNADAKPDLALANWTTNNVRTLQNNADLPAWIPTYPQFGNVDATSAEVLVNADRNGSVSLLCLPAGDKAPTSAQVLVGKNAAGATVAANFAASAPFLTGVPVSLACTSLSAMAYDIYAVAADSGGSRQLTPTKLAVDIREKIDTDNDAIPDVADNCPDTANADQSDFDLDTIGDLCDADDDNDGATDVTDDFPFNPAEWSDSDADGIGNNADSCPSIANADQSDFDKDMLGNVCDADDDNDGVIDVLDAFPLNPAEWVADSDGDGFKDDVDNCSAIANADQSDFDKDLFGNVCDPDDDDDGIVDTADLFPLNPAEWADSDHDGIGDNADPIVTTDSKMVAVPGKITAPHKSTNGTVKVSWSASATAGATYVVERSADRGKTWTRETQYASGTGTDVNVTALPNGNYKWRVKAVRNGYTDSSWRIGKKVMVKKSKR